MMLRTRSALRWVNVASRFGDFGELIFFSVDLLSLGLYIASLFRDRVRSTRI